MQNSSLLVLISQARILLLLPNKVLFSDCDILKIILFLFAHNEILDKPNQPLRQKAFNQIFGSARAHIYPQLLQIHQTTFYTSREIIARNNLWRREFSNFISFLIKEDLGDFTKSLIMIITRHRKDMSVYLHSEPLSSDKSLCFIQQIVYEVLHKEFGSNRTKLYLQDILVQKKACAKSQDDGSSWIERVVTTLLKVVYKSEGIVITPIMDLDIRLESISFLESIEKRKHVEVIETSKEEVKPLQPRLKDEKTIVSKLLTYPVVNNISRETNSYDIKDLVQGILTSHGLNSETKVKLTRQSIDNDFWETLIHGIRLVISKSGEIQKSNDVDRVKLKLQQHGCVIISDLDVILRSIIIQLDAWDTLWNEIFQNDKVKINFQGLLFGDISRDDLRKLIMINVK